MTRPLHHLLAVALTLGLLTASAAAASLTGRQLLSLCTANMNGRGNPLAAAECMGFVVGVADTFDCVEDNHGLTWNSMAPTSQPELVRLVVLRIQSDPRAQAGDGHRVVAETLAAQYPCPATSSGN